MAVVLIAGTSLADSGDDNPIDIVVSGSLRAPFSVARETLLDLEGFQRWFPALHSWIVLSRDAERAVVYGRQELPWPLADRDYVVDYHWFDRDDAFHLVATARTEGGPASEPGVVRLHELRSQWTIRPGRNGTEVRYEYRGDAGGSIPDWLSDYGWRAQANVLIEQLDAETERRR